MTSVSDAAKRVVFGRALPSHHLSHTLLPKRIALPVFASDALSSVSYATQEILLVLSLGGLALFAVSPWIALAVASVMAVVVMSYRQNVREYPSGGGDYEVATVNLGANAGLTVAAALMVDYVMTVAVSISAAVANISSAIPAVHDHMVVAAVLLIALITVMNLRGVRESGVLFAIPTYAFMLAIFGMVIWAAFRMARGDLLQAPSAGYEIKPEATYAGLALIFLLLRSFSSGCTALTGVEAISNGVPAFRPPKAQNAAKTLLVLGVIAVSMFLSVTALALITDVKVTEVNEDLIGLPAGAQQQTVIAQVAEAVFSNLPILAGVVMVVTALILVLAANTAFNGFPVLGSILAQDRYLPHQLHTRGDRLAFSNGIVLLAGFAAILVIGFGANVTRLIQLYILGVFVSFTLSQLGMVKHWNSLLATEPDPEERSRIHRARIISATGFVMTGVVLIIVLCTKFLQGAWIVCIAMPLLFLLMKGIRRHYDRVSLELEPLADETVSLPSRVHALVLVSKLHKPTLRALAYARATRPTTLEGLTVQVEPGEADGLLDDWERRKIPVPLTVLDSPYREITRPVLDYVKELRRESPRDLVTVYIPEYVVGHWWENLLHNQSALRLKARLLFTPGVMMVSVPWQLESSREASGRFSHDAPGSVRRGRPEPDAGTTEVDAGSVAPESGVR